ncbi:hypothetical protein D3C77_643340 [compost metagenome]
MKTVGQANGVGAAVQGARDVVIHVSTPVQGMVAVNAVVNQVLAVEMLVKVDTRSQEKVRMVKVISSAKREVKMVEKV